MAKLHFRVLGNGVADCEQGEIEASGVKPVKRDRRVVYLAGPRIYDRHSHAGCAASPLNHHHLTGRRAATS